MSMHKISKTSVVVTLGLISLFISLKDYAFIPRDLRAIKSYSSPGSIAAVMNTPKMGTGGLQRTFQKSWKCPNATPVPFMAVNQCDDGRRFTRTHWFGSGLRDIQKHREEYPEGQCLIVTALRNPVSWFGSMYLQKAKQHWKPKEEMIQDYKKFLAAGDFVSLTQVLPDLLKEFNAGTLIEQSRIMDKNGGYSLIHAPEKSALVGCDLLFLRMEQSHQWPDIFETLDPEIRNMKGNSRLDDHPENREQINAIAAYELTFEEKMNIYNKQDKFVREWFDAYGYMNNDVEFIV